MRQLGGGGMGAVSLCRSASGRLVAVKQVREEYADDPAFRSRFRREVAAARRVSGVYTAPVVDADTDGPRPWVATAYVPGPTLDQALRVGGTFTEPALRALGAALAEALQVIHAAGLVHRDFKPGNILLSDDGPRVIDFGISRALGETRLTVTGTVIGSPAFMAPEQVASLHAAGPESDVFALAGVLVYAACGEGPFGAGDHGVLHRIRTDEPDLDGVPAALHPLLLRCLDKTASRRPSPAAVLAELAPADPSDLLSAALRADLAARARDAALMAVAPPPPGREPGARSGRPGPGRRQLLIGALAAGMLAAGGAAAAWRWGNDGDGGADGGPGTDGKPLDGSARPFDLTDPPAPLWSAPLPMAAVFMPRLYGFDSAVVLDGGVAATAALDASTGRLRWKHGITPFGQPVPPDDPLPESAHLLGPMGKELLVSARIIPPGSVGRYVLRLVNPATGKARATVSLPGSDTVVQLLSSYGTTAYCTVHTVKLRFPSGTPTPGATPGVTFTSQESVVAVDMSSGAVRWRKPFVQNSLTDVRYASDRHGFYYTASNGEGLVVHALDADRGTSRWSIPVAADPDSILPPYMQAASGGLTSSLTAVGDLLIAVHKKGGLTAYDAVSGKRRWSAPVPAGSAPVRVGDLLVACDMQSVHALDLDTGRVRWSVRSPLLLNSFSFSRGGLSASEDVVAITFAELPAGMGGLLDAARGGGATGSPAPGGTGGGGTGATDTGTVSGFVVLRTSDGRQLWAVREKPRPLAVPSPAETIGSGVPVIPESWDVTVRGGTVFACGGGRIRAYRAGRAERT